MPRPLGDCAAQEAVEEAPDRAARAGLGEPHAPAVPACAGAPGRGAGRGRSVGGARRARWRGGAGSHRCVGFSKLGALALRSYRAAKARGPSAASARAEDLPPLRSPFVMRLRIPTSRPPCRLHRPRCGGARRRALASHRHRRHCSTALVSLQGARPRRRARRRGLGGSPSALLGGSVRAVVRASASAGEASDSTPRRHPPLAGGPAPAVAEVYNLTDTSGADESRPVIRDCRIAHVSRPALAEAAPTVHLVDLGGQPAVAADWDAPRARAERRHQPPDGPAEGHRAPNLRGGEGHPAAAGEPAPEGEAPRAGEAKNFERDVVVELDADRLVIRSMGRVAPIALAGRASCRRGSSWRARRSPSPATSCSGRSIRVRAVPWIGHYFACRPSRPWPSPRSTSCSATRRASPATRAPRASPRTSARASSIPPTRAMPLDLDF